MKEKNAIDKGKKVYDKEEFFSNVLKAGLMFLGCVLVMLSAGYIIRLIMLILQMKIDGESVGKFVESTAGMFVGQLIFFLPAMIFLILGKGKEIKKLRVKKMKLLNIILIPMLTVSLMPLAKVLDTLVQIFLKPEIVTTVDSILDESPLWLGFIVIAVVPAVFEEITYRGCIYNNIKEMGILKAALLNGLLFGAAHANFNQFSYAFVLGMVFCLVVEATDSLLSSMYMHIIINGTSFLSMYWAKQNSQDLEQIANQKPTLQLFMILIPMALAGLAFACFIYYVIATYSNRTEFIKEKLLNKKEDKIKKGRKIETFTPFIVGIVILFLIMFLEIIK